MQVADLDRTENGLDDGPSGLSKPGLPAPSSSPTPNDQRFRTTPEIVTAVAGVWRGIVLDPCAANYPAFWFADTNLTDAIVGASRDRWTVANGRAGRIGDGLGESWKEVAGSAGNGEGCAYVNPPWDEWGEWAEKIRAEVSGGFDRPIVGCFPQTGAKWITTMMVTGPAPSLVMLGKVKFHLADGDGPSKHTSFFPVSLAIWDERAARRRLTRDDLARRLGGWVA